MLKEEYEAFEGEHPKASQMVLFVKEQRSSNRKGLVTVQQKRV